MALDDPAAPALVELSDPDGNRVAETAQTPMRCSGAVGRHRLQLMLDSYHVHSVGIGADARGEANLSVRHEGVEYDGTGTSKDIIEASALAWLDVANRCAPAPGRRPQQHRRSHPATA